MSLFIITKRVKRVLLSGRWYTVLDDSFDLDAYEFIQNFHKSEGVDKFISTQPDGCTTGFTFATNTLCSTGKKRILMGPVQSIEAIEYEDDGKAVPNYLSDGKAVRIKL
jgi:hypothetical protein